MLSMEKSLQLAGELQEHGSRTEITLDKFGEFVKDITFNADYGEDDIYKKYIFLFRTQYPKEKKRQLRWLAHLYLTYAKDRYANQY